MRTARRSGGRRLRAAAVGVAAACAADLCAIASPRQLLNANAAVDGCDDSETPLTLAAAARRSEELEAALAEAVAREDYDTAAALKRELDDGIGSA